MKTVIIKKLSPGEEAFALHCRAVIPIAPVREHRFWPGRRHRFDFAWPDLMVAVEIEGGIRSGGRHTRGQGYINDLEKYNQATFMGWKVFRFATESVYNGEAIKMIAKVIGDSNVSEAHGSEQTRT